MASFRQDAFHGGEYSEELQGRFSLERYGVGLRTCRNFYPLVLGGLVNRPGFALCDDRSTKDHAQKVRVLPFVMSELPGQAYALELGHQYMRLHQGGGTVLAGAVPYELATPFDQADLAELRAAQDGDVVVLTHRAYGTRELRRKAHTDWQLVTISFIPDQARPTLLGMGAVDQAGDATHLAKEWEWVWTAVSADGVESLPSPVLLPATPSMKATLYGDRVVRTFSRPVDGAAYYRVYRGRNGVWGWVGDTDRKLWVNGTWNYYFDDDGQAPDFAQTPPAAHVPFTVRAWTADTRYEIGALVENGGQVYEAIEAGVSGAASSGGPAGLGAAIYDGAALGWENATAYAAGDRVVSAGSTYVAQSAGVSAAAPAGGPYLFPGDTDNGITWLHVGRGGAVKWRWSSAAPAPRPYPAVACWFEQRLVLAGAPAAPATLQFSATGQRTRFVSTGLSRDDSPISLNLAALTAQEIRSVVPARALVVLTSSAAWAVTGNGQGEPITPTNRTAQDQCTFGASWLPGLKVGANVLFAAASSRTVYALFDVLDRIAYDAEDVGIFSSHLFDGRTIVAWAYSHEPHRVVWAALDDGTLLSCTFEAKQKVFGWARHDVAGGGAVEDLCSIPEGGEHVVYAVVRRVVAGQTKRYIERLTSRLVKDARLGVFLDSAVSRDGRNTTATTITAQATSTWDPLAEVALTASADYFAGPHVGDAVVLDPDGAGAALTISSVLDPRHALAVIETSVPAALQGVATTSWALAADTLSGLGHLEGEDVTVLADGVVQGPFPVAGGTITLDTAAVIAHAGLPYDQEVETLDWYAPTADLRARLKAVSRVVVELLASRGELLVGTTLDEPDELRPWDRRSVDHGYGPMPLETCDAEVRPSSTWERAGRVAIRHSDPLPVHILGITREAEFGGR